MKRRLALVLLLPVVAGCAGAGSPAASGDAGSTTPEASTAHHIVVTAGDDFRFTPDRLSAASGPVTIELRDGGAYPHDISFPSLNTTSGTVTGSLGEQSTSLRLRLTPGTYRFVCTYHSKAGMAGVLTVH